MQVLAFWAGGVLAALGALLFLLGAATPLLDAMGLGAQGGLNMLLGGLLLMVFSGILRELVAMRGTLERLAARDAASRPTGEGGARTDIGNAAGAAAVAGVVSAAATGARTTDATARGGHEAGRENAGRQGGVEARKGGKDAVGPAREEGGAKGGGAGGAGGKGAGAQRGGGARTAGRRGDQPGRARNGKPRREKAREEKGARAAVAEGVPGAGNASASDKTHAPGKAGKGNGKHGAITSGQISLTPMAHEAPRKHEKDGGGQKAEKVPANEKDDTPGKGGVETSAEESATLESSLGASGDSPSESGSVQEAAPVEGEAKGTEKGGGGPPVAGDEPSSATSAAERATSAGDQQVMAAEEQPQREQTAAEVLYVVRETIMRGRPARVLSDCTIEAELEEEGWLRFEDENHLNEYLDALEAWRKSRQT